MNRICRHLFAASLLPFCMPALAQDEDCELAERYHSLAQDSLAEYDEATAAVRLERAAEACPRFVYFMELGGILMLSLDAAEQAKAVDAFISAYNVAETDGERAAALHQYASLLNQEGDLEHAAELIAQAQGLDPDNQEIVQLAGTISSQAGSSSAQQTVRALGASLYKPLSVEGTDDQSGSLRAYPWPPEEPSWRISVDRDLRSRLQPGMSMIDVEGLLADSLRDASYSEWRLYSAPGGFVMVTRFEAIDASGTPLGPDQRYALPGEQEDFSLFSFVRNLFDAPEGFYRFIAFVVTDQTYTASRSTLEESEALRRLRRGASSLPSEYGDIEFTDRHRIDALIYEFRKQGGDEDIETIVPGRIPGMSHLQNSGLSDALSN